MPGPIMGFLDGFQTQLTATLLNTDLTASFPTAGMVPGQLYHIRIDDSNPPTTFEYAVVQFQDSGTVSFYGGGAGRGIGGTAAGTHVFGPNSGYVTAVLLRESLLPTFARADTMNLMALASSSGISGQFFNAYGLPGAVQPSRYVGATTGGPPTTGTWQQGDFTLDPTNNVIYICTVAGTPGTWQDILTGLNTGMTGAVSSLTRWVGATGGGAPLTGTWKQGDVVTDRSGSIWVCIGSGTPGTWVSVFPTSAPQGTLPGGYAQIVANQGGITVQTDITGLTITVTIGAGRRIKITVVVNPSLTSAQLEQIVLVEGATTLKISQLNAAGTNGNTMTVVWVGTPSAGTHTYKVQALPFGGATMIINATITDPGFILAEDIGV